MSHVFSCQEKFKKPCGILKRNFANTYFCIISNFYTTVFVLFLRIEIVFSMHLILKQIQFSICDLFSSYFNLPWDHTWFPFDLTKLKMKIHNQNVFHFMHIFASKRFSHLFFLTNHNGSILCQKVFQSIFESHFI